MTPYFVTLGRGSTKYHGLFFLGENALYFLCGNKGKFPSGGYDRFGSIGEAIDTWAQTAGAPEPGIDERHLAQLTSTDEDSQAFTGDGLELLSQSMWGCKLVFGGEKWTVWNPGFPKPLRAQLGSWASQRNVATKGMK